MAERRAANLQECRETIEGKRVAAKESDSRKLQQSQPATSLRVAKRKPFPDPEKDGIRGNYVSVVHLKESVVFVEILMFLINGFMIYENEDCMQAWCWFSVLGHSLRPKIRRSSKSVVFCSGTQTASMPIKLDTYPFN